MKERLILKKKSVVIAGAVLLIAVLAIIISSCVKQAAPASSGKEEILDVSEPVKDSEQNIVETEASKGSESIDMADNSGHEQAQKEEEAKQPVGTHGTKGANRSENPDKSEEPGQTEEPSRPEEPGQAEEPSCSEDPGQSEEPGQPEEPGQTEEPSRSEDPGQSEEPGQPEEPGQTEEPSRSEDPGQAEEPSQPEEPGQAEEPSQPEEPGQPEGPTQPEEPGQPEGPTQPEEPGESEDPTQAEEPEYTDIPDETAYYLVWDDFTMLTPNSWSEKGWSSWDISTPTSMPAKAGGGACFSDESEYSDAHIQRQFQEISADFVWELNLKAEGALDGTTIDLKNQDTVAVRLQLNGQSLEAVTPDGNLTISEISNKRFTTLKIKVSPENGKYSVMADGAAAAKDICFLNESGTVDRMYIQTTEAGKGSLYLETLRIYTGYYVNEKFLNADKGTVSEEWSASGNVAVVYKAGTQGPDNYSVSMSDGAVLSREAEYVQDGAWVEYQLLIPESMDRFSMILEDAEGNSFEVATVDNQFGYYENGAFFPLYECRTNLWYHIMLKQTDEGGMLYLNHKLKAEGIELPFEKFSRMNFVAGNGQAYLDDIVLKDWIPYPEDYVPEPVSVEKDENDVIVGLQSCSLWAEGQHFGYDWLTQWDERTPYLGYYDEAVVETADWEIKYKADHGIDYELYCWYRPQDSNDEPIKYNRNSLALHEGYFNARYSDRIKFAITWECGGGPVSGSEDFRENVVPYWIEQYFKDERYFILDNKPVVGMYNISKLMSYFGGSTEGVKNELDYLRAECVKAGFDGCYIIMSNSAESNIDKIAAAGFDGQYAYSWGGNSFNIDFQKNCMLSFDQAVKKAGGTAGMIPVAGMGRDDSAWERDGGGYCTVEDFTELLTWMKEELIPALDGDSLGAKMILLDNWNEYGEGHFLMPSELYGFGYVDAVREIFGNNTLHEDVRPEDTQLERINHMYIQDREVKKVNRMNKDDADMEVLQGFYFEEDLEGFTVARWKGEALDVENLRAEDGAMKGNTHLGNEIYADPALLAPQIEWDANGVLQIKVRMKASVAADTPQLYFATDSEASFSQEKCVVGSYDQRKADEDGYTEVLFPVTSNAKWQGTITQIRLDPITVAGSFEIDSIEAQCRKDTNEAYVYLEGKRIYNSIPVKMVNNTVLFPVADIEELLFAQWTERLDKAAVELYVGSRNFYRLQYHTNTMTANGETIELVQGADVIDGEIYIPIAELMEAEGYTAQWNEDSGILSLAKQEPEEEPYAVLKGWYFEKTGDVEGFSRGGATGIAQEKGALVVTAAADGQPRVWSTDRSGVTFVRPLNVSAAEATHIRMLVKNSVEGQVLKLRAELVDGENGLHTITYEAPLPVETEYNSVVDSSAGAYSELLIDLKENAGWDDSWTLQRLGIFPFGDADTELKGESVSFDSIEILQFTGEEENYEVLKALTFDDGTLQNCGRGGSATVSIKNADGGSLTLTVKGADGKFWLPDSSNGSVLGISLSELTHIRLRMKPDKAVADMNYEMGFYTYTNTKILIGELKGIEIKAEEDGWAEVLVDCSSMTRTDKYDTASALDCISLICPYNAAAGGEQVFTIDYVEFLKAVNGSEPEPPVVSGGDDGVGEEAGDSYETLFGSYYFKNGTENWVVGGSTGLAYSDGALQVTAAADGKPRFWSCGETEGVTDNPIGISMADMTHIRVRIKSAAKDQKMALVVECRDSQDVKRTYKYENLEFVSSPDSYCEVLVDCSDIADDLTLARLGVYPYGMDGDTKRAGDVLYIGSIQFLRKREEGEAVKAPLKILVIGNSITRHDPNAGYGWLANWGMAATGADKDYVHLLRQKALNINSDIEMHCVNISEYEKYFYDWSLIKSDYSRYADFDADIIIAAIGANVKNGANEGDNGYNTDEIFTTKHYKAIVDRFNPGNDAKIIAAATPLTKAETVAVIQKAALNYDYEYVDMSDLTDTAYTAAKYEDELKTRFGVTYINAGVLTHPGDDGMAAMADRIWEKLKVMIGMTDGTVSGGDASEGDTNNDAVSDNNVSSGDIF